MLYAHKFHGKPVKIFARKKSEKASPPDKSKIEFRFKFIKGPIIKTTKEKNKLKNNGIKTNAKGIKILKLSSKVNEFAIQ